MSKITEAVEPVITPVITGMGYEVVDIEYKKQPEGMVLTVYIDKPQSDVDLNDCESVSRAIDPLLDEADPIPGSYYLSVSSPGLDRPLKKSADFLRNIGKEIAVTLYAAANGSSKHRGVIVALDEDAAVLTLDCGGKAAEFPLSNIASAKLWIEI